MKPQCRKKYQYWCLYACFPIFLSSSLRVDIVPATSTQRYQPTYAGGHFKLQSVKLTYYTFATTLPGGGSQPLFTVDKTELQPPFRNVRVSSPRHTDNPHSPIRELPAYPPSAIFPHSDSLVSSERIRCEFRRPGCWHQAGCTSGSERIIVWWPVMKQISMESCSQSILPNCFECWTF